MKKGLTIAKGNCNSMKSAIAGKMISDVKGFFEMSAAIAKLQNATSTIEGIHHQLAELAQI
jgi:hypothetical protein